MSAMSSVYKTRERLKGKRPVLLYLKLDAARMLAADPDNAMLQDRADRAAEAWLCNEEHLQLIEVRIDLARSPARRLYPFGDIDDVGMRVSITNARLERARARCLRKGEPVARARANVDDIEPPVVPILTIDDVRRAAYEKEARRHTPEGRREEKRRARREALARNQRERDEQAQRAALAELERLKREGIQK